MATTQLEFWDIDFDNIIERGSDEFIINDQSRIFKKRGFNLSNYQADWLNDHFSSPPHPKRKIGFFVVASQKNKQWPARYWIETGRELLRENDCILTIYGSSKPTEKALVHKIVHQLQQEFDSRRCLASISADFYTFCENFAQNDLIISNDSVGVHVANAMNVPVIALYFSSNGIIWGSLSDKFNRIQSKEGSNCNFQKDLSGSCSFYYGGCPAPCKYTAKPEAVIKMTHQIRQKQLTL
jgi:ADP-heptose:LPS heptosyltransferase